MKLTKTLTTCITILMISMFTQKAYSQQSALQNEIFGLGTSFESSRLLNTRMFIEGNYTVGRRTFEVGLTKDFQSANGQGFMFKHKIYLNKKKKSNLTFDLTNHKFRTFAIYKFVMFNSNTQNLRKDFEALEKDDFIKNTLAAPTINTIEHYFGAGFEIKTIANLYMEVTGVAGVNFIKNNSELIVFEDKLLPKANIDISWDVSVGFNYRF